MERLGRQPWCPADLPGLAWPGRGEQWGAVRPELEAGSPEALQCGSQSGQPTGRTEACAQIPDLLPGPLSVLGAAKNP